MHSKLIGSILLIVGTCVGAGMLALPIATAQLGFVGSLILLFVAWFVMTAGAFLILEVNLWLPQNSNLVSMARATIGPVGQIIAWATFLLLLYSLLCAYIAGGSDLLQHLLESVGVELTNSVTAILFVMIFGFVTYLGIKAIDYTNRVLMFAKFTGYFLLVILLMPYVSAEKILAGNLMSVTSATAVMVTITSFGYAAIVPSLRIYFAGDVKRLKQAILIGSLVPLVCYILWDMVIMGVIPLDGEHGLTAILHSDSSTSDLVSTLSATASSSSVTFFTKLFTSVAVVTSFLGVSLSLSDFLADGFSLEKVGKSKIVIYAMTFLPSVTIVLFKPDIFVKALEYAGIYCVVLLMLLPAWMVWMGRYHRKHPSDFTVPGGKPLLIVVMLASVILLVQTLV